MRKLTLLIGTLAFVACTGTGKKTKDFSDQWKANVQNLKSEYAELLPYILDAEKFNDEKNFDIIYKRTSTLFDLSTDISKHSSKKNTSEINSDPNLKNLSLSFKKEIGTALEGLTSSRREYSRFMLRSTLQYCIQCHSHNGGGPSLDSDVSSLEITRRLDKAEILIAYRDYSSALDILKKIILNPTAAEGESYQSQRAVDLALTVTVEHQQDPNLTSDVLNWIANSKSSRTSLKKLVLKWQKNVKEWKSEKKSSNSLKRAKILVSRAEKMKSYWGDRSGNLLYLRVSSLLHDHLRANGSQLKPKDNAETLYLLGLSYAAQPNQRFSYMGDYYFKSCIFAWPHSFLAKQCFEAYENRVINNMDFRTFNLPPSGLDYLKYLEKMAN